MDSLGGSFLLLVIALVLLWLAVTDRLSRLLDAVDVLRGNATASTTTTASTTPVATTGSVSLSLPSLPKIHTNAQVPV